MTIQTQNPPGPQVADKQTPESRQGLGSIANALSIANWSAAYDMVSPVAMKVREVTRAQYADPFGVPSAPYLLDETKFKALTDGVDPAYWSRFEDADNENHALAIRQEALQLTKDRTTLGKAGYGGFAATIGASFLDPTQLAIMVLTSGVGTAKGTINAARSARIAAMAETGLVRYVPRTLGFTSSVSVGSAEVSAFSEAAARAKSFGILTDDAIEFVVRHVRNGATAEQLNAATAAVIREVAKKQPSISGGFAAGEEFADGVGAIRRAFAATPKAGYVGSVGKTTTDIAAKHPAWLTSALVNAVPQAMLSQYQTEQQPEDFAPTDVASQFLGDFAFGAAASLTRGASLSKRILTGALAQGTPTLASDAVISDKDGTELMGAWAVNSLLGGAFNALNGGKATQLNRDIDDAAKNTIKRVQAETARQEGVPITTRGDRILEAPDFAGKFIDAETMDFDTDGTPGGPKGPTPPDGGRRPGIGLGAAGSDDPAFRSPKTRDNWKVGDFDATHADEENGFMSGLTKFANKYARLAPIARLMNSDIRELRYAATMFMTDPTKNVASLAGQVDTAKAAFRRRYFPVYDRLYAEAKTKIPGITTADFSEAVTKTIRRIGTTQLDPNNPIHKAAVEHMRIRDELVDYADRHGVPWSSWEKTNPDGTKARTRRFTEKDDRNYMPLMAKRPIIDSILGGTSKYGTLGSEKIRTLVEEAVYKALKVDLTDPDDVAKAQGAAAMLGRRWLQNVGTHNEALAAAETRMFSLDQRTQIVEELKAAGVHSDTIEGIVFGLGPTKQAEGRNPFKRRMPLDATHSIEWTDGYGVKQKLGIEDLLVNDVMVLTHRYADAVMGQSAFSEGMRVFSEKYGLDKPLETVGDFMGHLAKASGRADDPNLDRLRFAVNTTLGLPPPDFFIQRRGRLFTASRILRNANQAALLSNATAGVMNFTNNAWVLGNAGWDSVIHLAPAVGDISKLVATGKPPPAGILRMITDLGIGVHRIADRAMPYVSIEDGIAERVGWVENATIKAARFTNEVSGQRATTDLAEILAGSSMAEKLFRVAKSGKAFDADTLSSLGLNDQIAERIADQIKKHGVGTDINTGEFNLSKWDDLEAAANVQNSLIAFSRRVSWQPDPTELSKHFASEEYKLFFQMRKFGLTAYEHALVPIAQKLSKNPLDAKTWGLFATGSVVGALSYVVNSWIQSVGRPDQREYLERKLAPGEIAKAGFSRAIWSSLLPAAADAAIAGFGGETQFSGQRVTGLGQGKGWEATLTSNPTGDTLGAWGKSASGLVHSAFDPTYQFSIQDFRNIERGAFIPNILNFRTFLERVMLESGVPEKSHASYN